MCKLTNQYKLTGMKKLLILSVILAISVSCNNSGNKKSTGRYQTNISYSSRSYIPDAFL